MWCVNFIIIIILWFSFSFVLWLENFKRKSAQTFPKPNCDNYNTEVKATKDDYIALRKYELIHDLPEKSITYTLFKKLTDKSTSYWRAKDVGSEED